MAIVSKEDLMERVKARIGDDTSDESLAFIEDITDTLNDYEAKVSNPDTENWKEKYETLDKEWREKYKARFFSSEPAGKGNDPIPEPEPEPEPEGSDVTFDDLSQVKP